jgi:uncharacterized protein YbgA (DUF1722 family)
MKMICRGIVCHLIFISIEHDFMEYLSDYCSKTNHNQGHDRCREQRAHLYRLMRQLKAATAETNMLMDYRSYFRLIHADTMEQLLQWTSNTII